MYRLVRKSNNPFLVLKGVTEMSFLVFKRIGGDSEEDQYFILIVAYLLSYKLAT
jgi:hypothetical protein